MLLLLLISYLRFSETLPTAQIIKTPKKIEIIIILNSLIEPLSSLYTQFKSIHIDKDLF